MSAATIAITAMMTRSTLRAPHALLLTSFVSCIMAMKLFSNLTSIPSPSVHKATLIFLHGLGDTADSWASELKSFQKQFPNLKLVLPTAPIRPVTLNGGHPCTSWHDIHSLTSIDAEKMVGLEESRTAIQELVESEIQSGIPSDRIIIGGFSQGAALSLYAGLNMSSKVGGIISLSGYLPHYDVFVKSKLHNANRETPVLICHGDSDPVVQFKAGNKTARILTEAGLPVEFKPYFGLGHSVTGQEIADLIGFLRRIIQ